MLRHRAVVVRCVLGCALWWSSAGVALAQGTSAPGPAADPNQPPLGYPPPPPGYPPPQPAPDPNQPPQGYPPQPPPTYPQQPPPTYPQQQPPPGYPQPPAPTPQPQRAALFIGYFGAHVFTGKAADAYGPGFRLGGIAGLRAGPFLSLNGELGFDILNAKNQSSGEDLSGAVVELAFSPLLHLPSNGVELVVGPKLGLWGLYLEGTSSLGSESLSANGWLGGLNAGFFASLGPTAAIGGLLTFEARKYSEACFTDLTGTKNCASDGLGPADKVLGITAAILY
jgi:hypothetical protein